MAKWVHNDVLDGAWLVIKNNVTTMMACTAQPTDRADALSKSLADVAVGSGDITIADGDVSGRKFTVAAKSGVTVDTTGTATHVVLIDATRLLYVTTCTSQVLTSGNTVDFPAWKGEIADPS